MRRSRCPRVLVRTEDPSAFVVVTAATTVLGEGFQPLADRRQFREPLLDFLRRVGREAVR